MNFGVEPSNWPVIILLKKINSSFRSRQQLPTIPQWGLQHLKPFSSKPESWLSRSCAGLMQANTAAESSWVQSSVMFRMHRVAAFFPKSWLTWSFHSLISGVPWTLSPRIWKVNKEQNTPLQNIRAYRHTVILKRLLLLGLIYKKIEQYC